MKIITIGDLHGRDIWKVIADKHELYDRIIFIGDYVDQGMYNEQTKGWTQTISNEQIANNLLDIIAFKNAYPDKVVLLIGNHELPYLYFPDEERTYVCEGYRPDGQPELTVILQNNRRLFDVAYQYKNYLWTHAGVSNTWYADFFEKMKAFKIYPEWDIADTFNAINETALRKYLHQKGSSRMKFPAKEKQAGGITWADNNETATDYLSGFHQIVGHTPIKIFTTIGGGAESITYCDCLHSVEEFYEVEIKENEEDEHSLR